jgi:hypothetical protein
MSVSSLLRFLNFMLDLTDWANYHGQCIELQYTNGALGNFASRAEYTFPPRWKSHSVSLKSWSDIIYLTYCGLRCFPHIINIAAQTVLKELKENPRAPVLASSSDPTRRAHLEQYANALATDPVGGARTLVGVCRKSGQRRSDLRATIEEGNSNGSFRDENGTPVAAVPVQQLLRDCETRWSSTFNMTGRVIALYPVITSLFCMASKLILFLAGYYYFCSNTTPCRTRPPCICGSRACGAERHSPAT